MYTPLTYWGDDAFQLMLKDVHCLYYVEEVRAFILGAVLSCDSLTPQEAMDFLLKNEDGEDLPFDTTEHYNEFTSQFFCLWNQIAEYLNLDECPRLSIYPLTFENQDDRLSAAAIRANELKLFLTALNEGTQFKDITDEKVLDLLYYYEALAESLHEAVIRLNDRYEEEDLELIESMLEDSEVAWYAGYERMKTVLLDLRKVRLAKEKNTLIFADFGKKQSRPLPPPQ